MARGTMYRAARQQVHGSPLEVCNPVNHMNGESEPIVKIMSTVIGQIGYHLPPHADMVVIHLNGHIPVVSNRHQLPFIGRPPRVLIIMLWSGDCREEYGIHIRAGL